MNLITVAVALAGVAAGFGANQMGIRLSSKLEKMFSKMAKTGGNTAKWVGWFLAVALYAILAAGGATTLLSATAFKSLGAAKPYIGGFAAGFGLGGLASEVLLRMPDIETIGSV